MCSKIVVIAEGKRLNDVKTFCRKMLQERLGMSNGSNYHAAKTISIFMGNRQLFIIHLRKDDLLVFCRMQLLSNGFSVFFGQRRWTFRHNYYVGSLCSFCVLSKSAPRHYFVVGVEPTIVGKEKAFGGTYITMLKSIVEEHDLGFGMVRKKLVNACTAVFTNTNWYTAGIAEVHLEGLVANIFDARSWRSLYKPLCTAAVSSRKYSYAASIIEQMVDKPFGMGGLTGTAHSKIADADDGHIKTAFR